MVSCKKKEGGGLYRPSPILITLNNSEYLVVQMYQNKVNQQKYTLLFVFF